MRIFTFISLLVLGINSVLIQSIIPDGNLKNIIRISILIMAIFLLVINQKKIKKDLLVLTYVAVLLLFITKNIDLLTFIFIFIFQQLLYYIDTKRLEKYLLISASISFSIIFIFLLLGVTNNRIVDFRNRMTFGMNSIPFFYNSVYGFFTLLIVYSQKYFNKYRVLIIASSLIATTYFHLKTDIRGGYYSFLVFIFLLWLIPKIKNLKIVKYISTMLPGIFLMMSFILSSLSNNFKVNEIFSQRPMLLNNFFKSLKITDVIFSTSVKKLDNVNIVDNSYLHILIGGGIFISIMLGCLFYKAIRNLYIQRKYIEISFILSTCLYSNMESILVRVENIFIIYFWWLLIKYSSEQYKIFKNTDIMPKQLKLRRYKFKKYKIIWS